MNSSEFELSLQGYISDSPGKSVQSRTGRLVNFLLILNPPLAGSGLVLTDVVGGLMRLGRDS